MKKEHLPEANEINEEIEELENFLRVAGNVWTGKIVKRTSKFILNSTPYGIYNEAEYHMNTEIKNKVLDVLRERLRELNQKLADL